VIPGSRESKSAAPMVRILAERPCASAQGSGTRAYLIDPSGRTGIRILMPSSSDWESAERQCANTCVRLAEPSTEPAERNRAAWFRSVGRLLHCVFMLWAPLATIAWAPAEYLDQSRLNRDDAIRTQQGDPTARP
jgi:hypothetical protein